MRGGVGLWLWVDAGPCACLIAPKGCTCSQLLGVCHACLHLQGAIVLLVNRLLVTCDAAAEWWRGGRGVEPLGDTVARVPGAVVLPVLCCLCCLLPQLRGLEAASRKAVSRGRVHIFDTTAVSYLIQMQLQ